MKLKAWWQLLRTAAADWSDDNASRLAAALAYYTLLSLAPLLVLAVAVAGLVYGEDAARGQIAGELAQVVGPEAARGLQAIIEGARAPEAGMISSVVGVITLFIGASGVFGELQASLNQVWEVEPHPHGGVMGLLRERFFSFAMVVGVSFLLLMSLLMSAIISALGTFMAERLPGGETVWQGFNAVFSFATSTALFAVIFKVVPDVKLTLRDVWMGAFVTAFLFNIGKFALGYYLGTSTVASSYGAAGSMVALVIWVYYSAQILLFGAEFTQAYARRHGAEISPAHDAVKVPRRRSEPPLPKSSPGPLSHA